MTLFDIFVLTVVGFCVFFSLMKGLIREVFNLGSYVAGYFAAYNFHSQAEGYLKSYISHPMGARALSFFLLFMGVSLLVKLMGRFVQNLIATGDLSVVDRLLGAVLGAAKGGFIIAVCMIPLEFFPEIHGQVTGGSVTAPYIQQATGYLRQNMFTDKAIQEKTKSMGLDGIQSKVSNTVKDLKQVQEIKKQMTPPKSDPSGKDSPLDNYTEASKKELEDLLKKIQKQ